MTARPVPGSQPSDRGSVTLEVAVLAPALLMLLALAIVGGRYETAAGTVEATAAAAARAASLARTPTTARAAAHRMVTGSLHGQDLPCRGTTVSVDTSEYAIPPARAIATRTPAQVTVTVTCQLDLAHLAVPGVPGTRTIRATATSVLDTYRATIPAPSMPRSSAPTTRTSTTTPPTMTTGETP